MKRREGRKKESGERVKMFQTRVGLYLVTTIYEDDSGHYTVPGLYAPKRD